MSDFYSGEGRLLRVIKREDGRVLVVDCLKKTTMTASIAANWTKTRKNSQTA